MNDFLDPITRLFLGAEPLAKWFVIGYFAERITLLVVRELQSWRARTRQDRTER